MRRRRHGARRAWLEAAAAVCFVGASACSVGAESPFNHGVGTVGSASTSTSGTDDGSSSADATSSTSTSGADASSTGEPGPTSIVRGTVIDFGTLNMPVIGGVDVALSGDPSTHTVTADDGTFELAVPAGEIAFIEVTKPEYWGAIVRADVTAGDIDLGEINIANQTFIALKVEMFGNFDLEKAGLIARSTATDTTISLLENGQPATADDEYFSIDAQINFMLGDNVTRSAGFPAVVFFNLDDQDAGALTMIAAHPTMTCNVATPIPPVVAKQITWVEVACM